MFRLRSDLARISPQGFAEIMLTASIIGDPTKM